jgi:hypothetical protein
LIAKHGKPQKTKLVLAKRQGFFGGISKLVFSYTQGFFMHAPRGGIFPTPLGGIFKLPTGLEPATLRVESLCSIHLSYGSIPFNRRAICQRISQSSPPSAYPTLVSRTQRSMTCHIAANSVGSNPLDRHILETAYGGYPKDWDQME